MSSEQIEIAVIRRTLYCLGRTTLLLKRLLEEATTAWEGKQLLRSKIYRSPSKTRHSNGSYPWTMATSRSAQHMDSIILAEDKKAHLTQDMRRYFQPETCHGIISREFHIDAAT